MAGGNAPFRVNGRIQADGTFQLQAFPGVDGAPEGHFKVGITSRPGRTEGGSRPLSPRSKRVTRTFSVVVTPIPRRRDSRTRW